ncbi:ATP-binding protein [Nesterenkonia haasae]|uniref:ATP-binding protein n=1 Tax=Nesterenkonia haasae TaxID=2587813 RepID=UPI00139163E5|nr:ATP-binding protein [Nesterenkonia haasae]
MKDSSKNHDGAHASVTGTAELGFVEEVLDTLEDLYTTTGDVSAEDRTFFSLAVSEIATNIVTHGETETEVTVTADLAVDDESLSAEFQDDAEPVELPLEAAALPDEFAESGRGLAIAKMALDQLSHKADDGHTWHLMRRRRPGE